MTKPSRRWLYWGLLFVAIGVIDLVGYRSRTLGIAFGVITLITGLIFLMRYRRGEP